LKEDAVVDASEEVASRLTTQDGVRE
jgi:hypothetical protein